MMKKTTTEHIDSTDNDGDGRQQQRHLDDTVKKNVLPNQRIVPSTAVNHHVDLSKTDLIKLLSYLEGEVQARDVVIAVLKTDKAKQLLYQAKYGRLGANDPLAALQRDSNSAGIDDDFNERAVGHIYESQLVQLERLISVQRHAHHRSKQLLASAERRHLRTIRELENERMRSVADAAQGDDVCALLEKERQKLKNEVEYQKNESDRLLKEIEKGENNLRIEKERHKAMVLYLINERKQLLLKLQDERNKCDQLKTDAGARNQDQLLAELHKELAMIRREREELRKALLTERQECVNLREIVRTQEEDLTLIRQNILTKTRQLTQPKTSTVTSAPTSTTTSRLPKKGLVSSSTFPTATVDSNRFGTTVSPSSSQQQPSTSPMRAHSDHSKSVDATDWRGQRQPDGGNRDDWVIANDRAIRTTTASKPPIAPSQYATYSSSVAEPKRLLKSHSDHKSGTVAKSSGQHHQQSTYKYEMEPEIVQLDEVIKSMGGRESSSMPPKAVSTTTTTLMKTTNNDDDAMKSKRSSSLPRNGASGGAVASRGHATTMVLMHRSGTPTLTTTAVKPVDNSMSTGIPKQRTTTTTISNRVNTIRRMPLLKAIGVGRKEKKTSQV